jgi:hypothetical protein
MKVAIASNTVISRQNERLVKRETLGDCEADAGGSKDVGCGHGLDLP